MLASQQSTRKVESAVEELIIRPTATKIQQLGLGCLGNSHITARQLDSHWACKMLQPLSANSSWEGHIWSTVLARVSEADLLPHILLEILASIARASEKHPHEIVEEQAWHRERMP